MLALKVEKQPSRIENNESRRINNLRSINTQILFQVSDAVGIGHSMELVSTIILAYAEIGAHRAYSQKCTLG